MKHIPEMPVIGMDIAKNVLQIHIVDPETGEIERLKLKRNGEPGDVLIVTKLDRLGRNAMDVRTTVEKLAADAVRVHCLALGGVDLTSAAGKMTMSVLVAVAEFERDLLIERTQAGIARAEQKARYWDALQR